MNRLIARMFVGLYPRFWKRRYGAEFEAFLEAGAGGFRGGLDIVRSALDERISQTQEGGNMD